MLNTLCSNLHWVIVTCMHGLAGLLMPFLYDTITMAITVASDKTWRDRGDLQIGPSYDYLLFYDGGFSS